jgi:hypothetical protein
VLLVLFAVALFVFGRHGKDGELLRDGAIYVYSGERLLAGVPPFVSMFDHKGPLDTFLCAAGTALARATGRDELAAIRALCLATASACVPALFLLARTLFPRERPGGRFAPWIAAATLLGCAGFGGSGLGGPDPKTPVLLFVLLALALAARRSWFLAACAGSIASLGWQPTGIFAAVVPLLAHAQSVPGTRRRAVLVALGGLALPWILCAAWFASRSALYELADALVLFNVRFLESHATPLAHLGFMLLSVLTGFGAMGFPLVLGLGAMPALYAWRSREAPPGMRRVPALLADPFAVVLVTFPFPVIWSFLDFQGYPDFFVFLPYAALSFGWLLDRALHGVAELARLAPRARDALAATLVLAIVLLSAAQYHFTRPRQELQRQRADALRIEAKWGTEARLVSIGAPEVLVFLERVNPTRYGFIMRGIDRHIAAESDGGFAGWLGELEAWRPDVVVVSRDLASTLSPDVAGEWQAWLADYERDPEFTRWDVYARRHG